MKRLLILVALLAVVVPYLTGGCSSETKTYTDSGQVINASVNEEFIIALDSNPTTGYDWQENYDQSFLQLVRKDMTGKSANTGLVGSGGTDYFRFKALKAGEAKITMNYKRSWEAESAKQEVFTVSIK